MLFYETPADIERLPVAQHFLRGGRLREMFVGGGAEQIVVRRDDVLDGGRVLGFLKRQRAQQNSLIGNGRDNPFELTQQARGFGELSVHRHGLKCGGVEGRKLVEGGHGHVHQMYVGYT